MKHYCIFLSICFCSFFFGVRYIRINLNVGRKKEFQLNEVNQRWAAFLNRCKKYNQTTIYLNQLLDVDYLTMLRDRWQVGYTGYTQSPKALRDERKHVCHSFGCSREITTPFPGLLHFTLDPYLIMLSVKQGVSSTDLKVFGMTRPEIDPRFHGPLANTLLTRPMSQFDNRPIGLGVEYSPIAGETGVQSHVVIPKTQKVVLDTSLLNTQHYNARFMGKVEQSRKRSSPAPLHHCVVAIKKEAFG